MTTPSPEPVTDASPPPPKSQSWLEKFSDFVGIFAPLANREAPDPASMSGDWRSRLAFVFTLISVLYAILKFVQDASGLLIKPLTPLLATPFYLVGLLLAGGALFAFYAAVQARSERSRRLSLRLFLVLVVAGLAFGGWRFYESHRPPDGFLIIIAAFEGESATRKVDVARALAEDLADELQDVDLALEIRRIPEAFAEAEAARAYGSRQGAGLVIWGWYDDEAVRTHVELLHLPTLTPGTAQIPIFFATVSANSRNPLPSLQQPALDDANYLVEKTFVFPRAESFAVSGSDQMKYAATAIVALGLLAEGKRAEAQSLLDKAITLAEQNPVALQQQEMIYLHRASLRYAKGEVAGAVADLEQAVALAPDLYEAQYNLAIAYSTHCTPARQLLPALTAAERALQLNPAASGSYHLLADLYLQAEAPEKAIATLEAALQQEANAPVTHSLLASAYTAAGRSAEAQAAAQRAVTLREQALGDLANAAVDDLLALAAAYLTAERNEQALELYQLAQQRAPEDARPQRGLAVVYYRQRQFQEAKEAFQAAIRLAPGESVNHLLLGLLYAEMGDDAQARQSWQQAADLAPCDASPHLLLAGQAYLTNQLAVAAAEYRAALAIEPTRPSILHLLGAIQWQLGQLKEAAQSLEGALVQQDEPGVRNLLATVYADQGKFAEAATNYRQVAESAPDDADFYMALALDAEAVTAAQAALAEEASAAAHQALGDAYRRVGRLDLALPEYEAAFALDPDNAALRQTLGFAHWEQGWQYYQRCQPDAALGAANAALALDPQSTLFQVQAAGFLAAQGRTAEAERTYAQLQDAGAEDVLAHFYSANWLAQAGEPEKALAQYELALSPTANLTFTSLIHLYRAQLHVQQADLAAAEDDLNGALDLLPSNAEAYLWLGDLALLRGQPSDALTHYDTALNELPAYTPITGVDAAESLRVYLLVRRGLALQRLKRPADAEQALDAALVQAQLLHKLGKGGRWPLANFAVGVVNTLLGNTAEAEQAFAAAVECDQSLAIAREVAEKHLAKLQGSP